MWNRGSEVMSRSSAVSCIQDGKPSPAITYARCVCITSLERPVVPDVGIITATASGSSAVGPRPSGSPVNSSSMSTTRAVEPVSATADDTSGARGGSVTIRPGSTWLTKPDSSVGVEPGLIGTWVAPTSIRASHASRYEAVFRAVTSTRSPGPRPHERNEPAARSMRSRASA